MHVDDTARNALIQARYRLRSARHHATFPPHVPSRVVGELSFALKALKEAEDAVARLIDQGVERAEPLVGWPDPGCITPQGYIQGRSYQLPRTGTNRRRAR